MPTKLADNLLDLKTDFKLSKICYIELKNDYTFIFTIEYVEYGKSLFANKFDLNLDVLYWAKKKINQVKWRQNPDVDHSTNYINVAVLCGRCILWGRFQFAGLVYIFRILLYL